MTRKSTWLLLTQIVFVLWLAFAGLHVVLAGANNDEGWYCLIAREVWNGRALYSDIRFTQAPFLPYFYGAFLSFLPPRIEAARAISLVVSAAGVLLLWQILRERYREQSTLAGLLLVLLSPMLVIDLTSVRTQALSFFLSTLCVFFSHRASHPRFATPARDIQFSALFAGLTITTRLSFLPLLALPALIAFTRRDTLPLPRTRFWPLLLWSGVLFPLGVFSFYFFSAGDRFLFGVFNFHAILGQSTPSLQQSALQNAVSNILTFSLDTLPWAIALWVITIWMIRQWLLRKPKLQLRALNEHHFEIAIAIAFLLITAIHITRRPAFPTYQTPLAWAIAILVAFALSQWLQSSPEELRQRRAIVTLFWAIVISGCSWTWMGIGLSFDRARRPVGTYDFAAPLRSAPGKTLVAFDAALAFNAPKIKLLPGYEMAEFSLLPPLPAERQEYFRGVSYRRFREDLKRADFVALRPMDISCLRLANPKLKPEEITFLLRDFTPISHLDSYGHLGGPITLYGRKLPAKPDSSARAMNG